VEVWLERLAKNVGVSIDFGRIVYAFHAFTTGTDSFEGFEPCNLPKYTHV